MAKSKRAKRKKLTLSETVDVMSKLLVQLNAKSKVKDVGACILDLPSGPKCVMLSPDQCSQINGTYIGGECQQ